jgi:hypothetical protein
MGNAGEHWSAQFQIPFEYIPVTVVSQNINKCVFDQRLFQQNFSISGYAQCQSKLWYFRFVYSFLWIMHVWIYWESKIRNHHDNIKFCNISKLFQITIYLQNVFMNLFVCLSICLYLWLPNGPDKSSYSVFDLKGEITCFVSSFESHKRRKWLILHLRCTRDQELNLGCRSLGSSVILTTLSTGPHLKWQLRMQCLW